MKSSIYKKVIVYLLVTVMVFGLGIMQGVPAFAGEKTDFARLFPETTDKTLIFADQLPTINNLTPEQLKFIADNYVGAQKLTVPTTRAIREINPNFLMLHYHLAIWQSAVSYIVDGYNWDNDYDYVTQFEDWFMHRFNPDTGEVYANEENRVYAFDDHKYLMNIMNEDYYQYFLNKLITQCRAGEYDGVFLDSYHTAVLNYYLQNYREYAGPSAAFSTYPELGENMSWKTATEIFSVRLTKDLNDAGIYSLPNLGNFGTTWDKTDYTLTDGGMTESAFNWGNLPDWKQGMNGHLKLVNNDKIDMCQEYLSDPWSYQRRYYFLGSYLLLRGKYTYLYYFNSSTLEYYPEYDLDLGAPVTSAGDNIDNLLVDGLYVRDFEKGKVIVCPRGAQSAFYQIPEDENYMQVSVKGTGEVASNGTINGWLKFEPISGSIKVDPFNAVILVKKPSITNASMTQLETVFAAFRGGDIKGEIVALLQNKIRQTYHKLDVGRIDQAIKQLEDFVKHINNPELDGYVSTSARYTLDAYANGVIKGLQE